MRKGIIVVLLTIFLGSIVLVLSKKESAVPSGVHSGSLPTKVQPITTVKKVLFVPYWTLQTPLDTTYDEYVYFGIEANEQGINKNDDGFKRLGQFTRATTGKRKVLTIRMIDSSDNARILEKKDIQENIAKSAAAIATQYGFDEVLLDFEFSALSFESVIKQVTALVSVFSTITKQNNLAFSVTLFGDTFFRLRPYDIATITPLTDRVFIMAYDFHKSTENPGPTFPFGGKNIYGYDFHTMIDDFANVTPREKLVVVIGLFGYDWTVDKKEQSTEAAAPLSYYKAAKLFTECTLKNCTVTRDRLSGGMHATYTIGQELHSVWYEDPISSSQKQEYLKEQGIGTVGFWAHSFF